MISFAELWNMELEQERLTESLLQHQDKHDNIYKNKAVQNKS